MQQFTNTLTINMNARRLYLAAWHRALRVGLAPALALLAVYMLWNAGATYGIGVAAGLLITLIHGAVWYLPELVDRFKGERLELAKLDGERLVLNLEAVHEVDLGRARVEIAGAGWPRSRLRIVITGQHSEELRSAIYHVPLIKFIERAQASRGTDKEAGIA